MGNKESYYVGLIVCLQYQSVKVSGQLYALFSAVLKVLCKVKQGKALEASVISAMTGYVKFYTEAILEAITHIPHN